MNLNPREINLIIINICSFLVIIGSIGNIASIVVCCLKSKHKVARRFVNNLLIILMISNTLYLAVYWYAQILPKILNHLKYSQLTNLKFNNTKTFNLTINSNLTLYLLVESAFEPFSIEKFYRINSNLFICKTTFYLISILIFMNSFLTMFFSLKRALIIVFPLKSIHLRERYKTLFKSILVLTVIYSFLFPAYNLFIVEIVKYGKNYSDERCDIPKNQEHLYFKFTLAFVAQTLAMPFILITLANISIVIVIKSNNQKFKVSKYSQKRHQSDSFILKYFNKSNHNRIIEENFENSSKGFRFGGRSQKSSHIHKIFFMISASFCIFNLPYFIFWSKYAIFRINHKEPYTESQKETILNLKEMLKLSEILFLLNYSINGFLYFATSNLVFILNK